ncbi:MAG: hypothetical protein WBI14_08840, partial [Anaerolineaceae bacterium]
RIRILKFFSISQKFFKKRTFIHQTLTIVLRVAKKLLRDPVIKSRYDTSNNDTSNKDYPSRGHQPLVGLAGVINIKGLEKVLTNPHKMIAMRKSINYFIRLCDCCVSGKQEPAFIGLADL